MRPTPSIPQFGIALWVCQISLTDAAACQAPQLSLSPSTLSDGAGLQALPESGDFLLLGSDYAARLGPAGLELTPLLGARVEQAQTLALSTLAVERGGHLLWYAGGTAAGAFEAQGLRAERPLGKLASERFEARPEGVELSYLFPNKPDGSGDLVVRLALQSSFGPPALQQADRLEFLTGSPGQGSGVSIGAVTGIAADGQRSAGRLHYSNGELLLSLPEAFVEGAAYPLLLDPLLGPVLTVVGDLPFLTSDDYDPDLAFDVSSGQYLVVWERAVSAAQSRIFARRFDENGSATSSIFQLSVDPTFAGTSAQPAVANMGGLNSWCVAFRSSSESFFGSTTYSIQALLLGNQFSSVPAPIQVASGPELLTSPDVGGQQGPDNSIFAVATAVFAWTRNGNLDVSRAQFNSLGQLSGLEATETVAFAGSSVFGSLSFSSPQLSRCATSSAWGGGDRFLLTAQAVRTLGSATTYRAIVGWPLRAAGLPIQGGSQTDILGSASALAPTGNYYRPAADGLDRQWVVAAQDGNPGQIVARSVRLASDGTSLLLGASATVSSGGVIDLTPGIAVAYAPGKTWIGWRSFGAFLLSGLDSQSLIQAEGPLQLGAAANGAQEIIAIASAYSGGPFIDNPSGPSNLPSERALALWAVDDATGTSDILGQALNNTAGGGSYQNLGGGCGSQGSVTFPKTPSIGTSAWQTRIQNLPATTAAAFYNLTTASSGLAIPCGLCQWMPFETTGPATLTGTTTKSAHQTLTIPAKPNLVGAQLIVQWTLVDLANNPCASFPGLSVSARWRATLGL
jgi:hypothetical protein